MNVEENIPEPNKFPNNRLFLIYGSPKTGKSTFAASWDNPLMVDLENGTSDIKCTRIRPRTYKELTTDLKDPDISNYDTIVIDSIDIVYNMLERIVINRLNKQLKTNYSYIGDFPMGAGWSGVKNGMSSWIYEYIDPLLQQDKNVILIGHEKSETIKRQGKDDLTQYKVNLSGKTGDMVTSLCHVIGRVYIKNNGKHHISFSGSHDIAGSRIKALAGRDVPLNIKVMRSVIEKYTPKPGKTMGEIVDQAKE